MSDLLAVNHLTMRFGGLTAIDDVSFAAKNMEITAIIQSELKLKAVHE